MAQFVNQVNLPHLQAQGVVLQFIEVHHLIHQPQHAAHAALHDEEQPLLAPLNLGGLAELVHRAANHGERGAELVADVGKEAHVHPVDALFLLLLLASLAHHHLPLADALDVAGKECHYAGGQQQVEAPGPPGEPRGGLDGDADGGFGIGVVEVACQRTDVEGVTAGGQVGVVGFAHVVRFYPVLVDPL